MGSDRTTAASAIVDDGGGERGGEAAFLVVYGEDAAGGPSTRVVPLEEGGTVSIGRAESNTLPVVSDQVSRHHARVTRGGGEIAVEDLGSRNGTRVNGAVIAGRTLLASGDEVAIGPLVAVVSVTARARRRAQVPSPAELDERLAAELDRARRYRRPLALVMLRVEGTAEAQGSAIDRVSRRLRRMDVLAQYGPDELCILFPEAERGAAEVAAQRLVDDARGEAGGVAVHVGLAVYPGDAATAGELVSRARAALRSARAGAGAGGVATAPAEARPADVVVVDPAMQRAMALAQRVAAAPMTVLVLGETGVGKEIVAAAIHRMSPRAARPMVAINCAAVPETLLESALFGHERGAFTGADRRQVGYFEAADGGSIFLDEVGEMPAALQAKLLRVLEQRAITRVGGTATIPVDVRVICATNRDLDEEVRRGRFREDLYFRICGFTLAVPPLRQRVGDVAPLARQFARQFARELGQPEPVLDAEAIAALERYDWPGNVRQLRNAVERAVVMATDGAVGLEHLPEEVLGDRDAAGGAGEAPASIVKARVAQVERQTAVEALAACGGNQSQAARRLGMSRWAFIRLMRKYDLA